MNPEFICDARQGLKQHDADKIIALLKAGGLCILPSDSSYTLTGLVTDQNVSRDIDLLLERNGVPMSLAFGSLRKAAEKMKFSNQAYKFLEKLAPGGLTFVAHPKRKAFGNLSKHCLYADGTIGVRLTESLIETQIADYFPIPTAPIRSSDGREISTAEEAWEIIAGRSAKLHSLREIAVIDSSVKAPGRLSTVVKEELQNGYWCIKIIRRGAVSDEKILETALECMYKGVI